MVLTRASPLPSTDLSAGSSPQADEGAPFCTNATATEPSSSARVGASGPVKLIPMGACAEQAAGPGNETIGDGAVELSAGPPARRTRATRAAPGTAALLDDKDVVAAASAIVGAEGSVAAPTKRPRRASAVSDATAVSDAVAESTADAASSTPLPTPCGERVGDIATEAEGYKLFLSDKNALGYMNVCRNRGGYRATYLNKHLGKFDTPVAAAVAYAKAVEAAEDTTAEQAAAGPGDMIGDDAVEVSAGPPARRTRATRAALGTAALLDDKDVVAVASAIDGAEGSVAAPTKRPRRASTASDAAAESTANVANSTPLPTPYGERVGEDVSTEADGYNLFLSDKSASGYKGVSVTDGRYQADYRNRHLGKFDTAVAAAIAYAKAAHAEESPRALEVLGTFLASHDVVFNGSRQRIPGYDLGAPQCWSILHLNQARRAKNETTLEGIAQIMRQHGQIACEVRGMTTPMEDGAADVDLARHFNLDPIRDADAVQAKLSLLRAEACVAALVERGIEASRLSASSAVICLGERNITVDFLPHVAQPSPHPELVAAVEASVAATANAEAVEAAEDTTAERVLRRAARLSDPPAESTADVVASSKPLPAPCQPANAANERQAKGRNAKAKAASVEPSAASEPPVGIASAAATSVTEAIEASDDTVAEQVAVGAGVEMIGEEVVTEAEGYTLFRSENANSGYLGVTLCRNRYQAFYQRYLGRFDTAVAAAVAVAKAVEAAGGGSVKQVLQREATPSDPAAESTADAAGSTPLPAPYQPPAERVATSRGRAAGTATDPSGGGASGSAALKTHAGGYELILAGRTAKPSKTGYKGVYPLFNGIPGWFRAELRGKNLGSFDNVFDAAIAYAKAVRAEELKAAEAASAAKLRAADAKLRAADAKLMAPAATEQPVAEASAASSAPLSTTALPSARSRAPIVTFAQEQAAERAREEAARDAAKEAVKQQARERKEAAAAAAAAAAEARGEQSGCAASEHDQTGDSEDEGAEDAEGEGKDTTATPETTVVDGVKLLLSTKSSTGYKGVYYVIKRGRFRAEYPPGTNLGVFDTPVEAALAYASERLRAEKEAEQEAEQQAMKEAKKAARRAERDVSKKADAEHLARQEAEAEELARREEEEAMRDMPPRASTPVVAAEAADGSSEEEQAR